MSIYLNKCESDVYNISQHDFYLHRNKPQQKITRTFSVYHYFNLLRLDANVFYSNFHNRVSMWTELAQNT